MKGGGTRGGGAKRGGGGGWMREYGFPEFLGEGVLKIMFFVSGVTAIYYT